MALATGTMGFTLDIKRRRATTIVIIGTAIVQKFLTLGKILLHKQFDNYQLTYVIDYKA
jgi:hypothetical protein